MKKNEGLMAAADSQGLPENIVERRKSRDFLRESERRLRLALDSAEMGTWDWNLTTDELLWDERQYELFA